MERDEIINDLIKLWQECEDRDCSVIDKTDIDFVNKIADYIIERDMQPLTSKLVGRAVLVVDDNEIDKITTALINVQRKMGIEQPIHKAEQVPSEYFKKSREIINLEFPPLIDLVKYDEPTHSPIYTPKRKKFKRR